MRDLPRAARIAIATLYLRYRDARRCARQAQRTHGRMSAIGVELKNREIVIWNDLQAVGVNVLNGTISTDTKSFVRFSATQGRNKNK